MINYCNTFVKLFLERFQDQSAQNVKNFVFFKTSNTLKSLQLSLSLSNIALTFCRPAKQLFLQTDETYNSRGQSSAEFRGLKEEVMSTEIAGTMSRGSTWGVSVNSGYNAVFESAEQPATDNGNAFQLNPGVHYKLSDSRMSNAISSLRFGPSVSYVIFPAVPDGTKTREGRETRVGGSFGLDLAFRGHYDGYYFMKRRPSGFGFRLEMIGQYSLNGPQGGRTQLGEQVSVETGTFLGNFSFLFGVLKGLANDDRVEVMTGFQISTRIFNL